MHKYSNIIHIICQKYTTTKTGLESHGNCGLAKLCAECIFLTWEILWDYAGRPQEDVMLNLKPDLGPDFENILVKASKILCFTSTPEFKVFHIFGVT